MDDVNRSRPHLFAEARVRRIPLESRVAAFWRTLIGKKVAMAVTGAVLV